MKSIHWGIISVLICVILLLTWPYESNRTSAEIRLDTGDIRYLRNDTVIETLKLEEPYRTTILAASKKSEILNDDWYRCATFPLPSSNQSHKMCRTFYRQAAVWMSADSEIGLLVLEDIAHYIKTTNAEYSLPDCHLLLSLVSQRPDGTEFLPEGWQDYDLVKNFLSRAKPAPE